MTAPLYQPNACSRQAVCLLLSRFSFLFPAGQIDHRSSLLTTVVYNREHLCMCHFKKFDFSIIIRLQLIEKRPILRVLPEVSKVPTSVQPPLKTVVVLHRATRTAW